jgi:Tol biopolymer transport system component
MKRFSFASPSFALIAAFASLALFTFCVPVSAQNHTIQQYLNIRSASSPSLSSDGKRLLYLTNVSGTSQIWAIDLPSGAPKQITNYEDNVGFVRRSPGGNGVVFGKARGGDENTQFFWMREDGSNVRQLTDAAQVRHNFGEWSKDGKRIYYTSNKRDRNWFDVYVMDVASGKEEMLVQQDGSNSVAAVSDDGSKIIVSRASVRFSLDNDLYLLDTKTKTATHLTPHDTATQYSDVHFLHGGNSIVLGTNQNSEFIALSKMDLATRKMENLGKASWDLDATAFSPDDKMFAYTVNREGFSELYVALSASMNKELPVQLPAQGIVGGLDFSKDGTKLAFSFVSAKNNSDVWLYDLASKKLTQITRSDRAEIDGNSFVEPQLIKFTSFDRREIPAWFYKPRSTNLAVTPIASETKTIKVGNKNFPVIISVHGGPEGQERPVSIRFINIICRAVTRFWRLTCAARPATAKLSPRSTTWKNAKIRSKI